MVVEEKREKKQKVEVKKKTKEDNLKEESLAQHLIFENGNIDLY